MQWEGQGVSCSQAVISEVLHPTTTTTSEATGESSNTAEDLTEEERQRREGVRLAGSATKFTKQVLDQVAERHRISTRKSCALEWLRTVSFAICGDKGLDVTQGMEGPLWKNDKDSE